LQHSNSWVVGEEPSDPTARWARAKLWTAARVLDFRGTARGDVRRDEAGESRGEAAKKGRKERPRGEAARRGREERPQREARGEAAR
jgi:hypothetical protein